MILRKPPYSIQIRTGKGGEYDQKERKWLPMEDWGFGRVERWTGDGWAEHADFARFSDDGGFTSFIIEFVHDLPQANFYSNLACYDGGTPFCFRCHRGTKDTVGIAQRRWRTEGGQIVYRKIECDPSLCDLRLLTTTGDEESNAGLPPAYKRIYGAGLKDTGKQPPKCKAQNWLLFRLLYPDGSDYCHGPFELAALNTHSDMTHGLIATKLDQMYLECGGKLTGFRMELRARPFLTRFKKTKTAWELVTLSGSSVEEQKEQAGQRRLVKKADYEALAENRALALVGEDTERSLAQFSPSEEVDRQIERAKAAAELAAFEAEYIDPATVDLPTANPFIQKLMERLRLEYADRVALPLIHGYDHYRVACALAQMAKRHDPPIPFRDIWVPYMESLGVDTETAAKPASAPKAEPQQPTPAPEPEDADIATVCPKCAKDAWQKPDGSIECPSCSEEERLASDLSRVRGEQQSLL